jgi:hypothetical protein
VQARISNLKDQEYDDAMNTFNTLRTNWTKVKPALKTNPRANKDWHQYVNKQLAALEQQVGIIKNVTDQNNK